MAQQSYFSLLFLTIITIFKLHLATSKQKHISFSLELVHRDSPKSPLYPGNITFLERVQQYAKISNARIEYLVMPINEKTNFEFIHPLVSYDTLFTYIVHVNMGTPPRDLWLLLDTGGNLIWTQCLPCVYCYKQRYLVFNPGDSKTYSKIPCSNPLCGTGNSYRCVGDECRYNIRYSDGTTTEGILSWETFYFELSEKSREQINDVLFGCSNINSQPHLRQTSRMSGVLGLSRGRNSLISQLGVLVLNRFSYCLADPRLKTSTYLKFGTDMGLRGGAVQTTPFVKLPANNDLYGLNLLGISVNGTRLNIPPNTFAVKPGGKGGTMIDSGSALSYIISDAYPLLEKAFEDYFAHFKLERRYDCVSFGILCYRLPKDHHSFPSMTYHLDGADFVVPPTSTVVASHEEGFVKVPILPKHTSIIGSWQQHNTLFVYDLNMNSLWFVGEDCVQN